jgi:hypothetical protein
MRSSEELRIEKVAKFNESKVAPASLIARKDEKEDGA